MSPKSGYLTVTPPGGTGKSTDVGAPTETVSATPASGNAVFVHEEVICPPELQTWGGLAGVRTWRGWSLSPGAYVFNVVDDHSRQLVERPVTQAYELRVFGERAMVSSIEAEDALSSRLEAVTVQLQSMMQVAEKLREAVEERETAHVLVDRAKEIVKRLVGRRHGPTDHAPPGSSNEDAPSRNEDLDPAESFMAATVRSLGQSKSLLDKLTTSANRLRDTLDEAVG